METEPDFLDQLETHLRPPPGPRSMPWPGVGQPHGFRSFTTFDDWKGYVRAIALGSPVPLIVETKYQRAQKLYLLGWLDGDFVKAGEMVSLATLELAVRDRYWQHVVSQRKPRPPKPGGGPAKRPMITFAELLDYMVTGDGLTDDTLTVVKDHGGSVVRRLVLTEPVRPTLAELRNEAAHGHPFDGFPRCGLIEVVRDLISYAYRSWVAQPPPPIPWPDFETLDEDGFS